MPSIVTEASSSVVLRLHLVPLAVLPWHCSLSSFKSMMVSLVAVAAGVTSVGAISVS